MNRSLLIALSLLAGCTLVHDDNSDRVHAGKSGGSNGGDDGVDGCSGGSGQVQLLNPFTLACQSFSTGSDCDPSTCDSCPPSADAGAIVLPNWASCQSSCLAQTEQECSLIPGCRVTKEANRYYGISGGDPFLGCFPVNSEAPPIDAGCQFLTAETCSSDSQCWAVYDAPSGVQCGIEHAEGCPSGAFVACVDAGATLPGRCGIDLTITCPTAMPVCPSGTQPGINDNCYTGLCIPSQYCTTTAF